MEAPVSKRFSTENAHPSFSDSFSSPSFEFAPADNAIASPPVEFAPINVSNTWDFQPAQSNDIVAPQGLDPFRDTQITAKNYTVDIFEIPPSEPPFGGVAEEPQSHPEFMSDFEAPEAIGNMAVGTLPFADPEPAYEEVDFRNTGIELYKNPQDSEQESNPEQQSDSNVSNRGFNQDPHIANVYANRQYEQAVATLHDMEAAGFDKDESVERISQIFVQQAEEEGFIQRKEIEAQETEELIEAPQPIDYVIDDETNANRQEALMEAWLVSNTGEGIVSRLPLAIEKDPAFTSGMLKDDVEERSTNPDGGYKQMLDDVSALGKLPDSEHEAAETFTAVVLKHTAVDYGPIFQATPATEEQIQEVLSPVTDSLFF